MNIEFHEQQGLVKPWILDYMRNQLIELHHIYPDLHRAQVYFKTGGKAQREKVCEIDIPIFGSSIYLHRSADSFEKAGRDVIHELKEIVEDRASRKNELPDTIISSIEIEEDENDLS